MKIIGVLPECTYSNSCHATTTSDYVIGTILVVIVFFLIWLANRKRKSSGD